MDKIPLRTYLKEIETLIDKGENDQAIAHCRHILKAHPKNLETYRLLGKAYLECHRYGDAADVFQRVLSGVPDDFVSHVGMSIIREDESNQDAAIWHMERAFEIQPYNSAIQDELRRLYGRRDGLEPPKVRLTRGALARMYARGNLYQQAIGELRAALAEDPKRSDLQVLLARMYFMAGQKVEAVETCSTLLKKLPYCLEANRIISAILPETERKEETQIYRERVMSLDPYLVLVSPYETTSEGVRDQVVVIEKLDYQEGQVDGTSQPAWAASLGVTFEEFKSGDEPVPDWLQAISDGQAPVGPATPSQNLSVGQAPIEESLSPEASLLGEEDELIPGMEGDEELPSWISFPDQPSGKLSQSATGEIPEWMKEAGWEAQSGSVESNLPAFEYPEAEEIDEAEIEKGELPPWLQSLAPAGSEEGGTLSDDDALLASMPWLNEAESESEQAQQIQEAVPDWLDELGAKPEEVAVEAPDWLKELEEAGPAGELETVAEEAVFGEDVIERESSEPVEVVLDRMEGDVGMGDMADFKFEDEQILKPEELEGTLEGSSDPEPEMPEWLKEMAGEEGTATDELAALADEGAPVAADMAAGLSSEGLLDLGDDGQEEIPDWLRDTDETAAESIELVPAAEVESEPVAEEVEGEEELEVELPESIFEIESQEIVTEIAETPQEADYLLEELAPESTAFIDASGSTPSEANEIPEYDGETGSEEDEVPEWLKELKAEQPEEGLVEVGVSAPDLEEAVLAEEQPDWMQEIMPEVTEARTDETETDETETEEGKGFEGFDASEEVPDWLREFSQGVEEAKLDEIQIDELDTGEPLEEGVLAPAEEIPAWLRDLEEENLAQTMVDLNRLEGSEITSPQMAENSGTDDEQDWLQIIGEKPLHAQPSYEGGEDDALPDYSPEDLEALLADTQPVRVSWEEPTEPFNEILEEIDAGMQVHEISESLEVTSSGIEAPSGDFEATIENEVEDAVPGIFGAALTPPDTEDLLSGEEPVQGEPEQELPFTEGAVSIPPFELDDQDAGMAWLESLAAKHGVSEEELFSSPEERAETYPVDEEISEAFEAGEMEAARAVLSEPEETDLGDQVSEEGLLWVEESALSEGDQAELSDVPEWLIELKSEDQVETEVDAVVSTFEAKEMTLPGQDTEVHADVEPAEEVVDEEIPIWLKDMQSEAEEELSQRQVEVGSGQESEVADSDAAMAWLESLAAKQGVPEGELFTKPEDRIESPPAWIEEEAEVTEDSPLPIDIEAIESPSITEEPAQQPIQTLASEETAPEEAQSEAEEGAIQEAIEVVETYPSEPAQTEEPELPEWLSETEKGVVEEDEWVMPVEPVKAALREPRPGTAPLAMPPSQPVDINKAALIDLETLPGVGFILAQNILTYRDAFGPYKDIEDLIKVPGITPGILSEISEYLAVPPVQEAPRQIEPELMDEVQASLLIARNKLAEGDIAGTVAQYSKLVKNSEILPEIIRDLKEALYRFPVDIGLWQTLGDAYMRSDQLTEALEAYTKAEELLR